MTKGLLHLSIEIEILSLIKEKLSGISISNYVENIFKQELELTNGSQKSDLEHLKQINSKLVSNNSKARTEINIKNKEIDILSKELVNAKNELRKAKAQEGVFEYKPIR